MERRRQLAAIVFMDVARYSALMAEDETKALRALKRARKVIKRATRRYKGDWLESPGESNLLKFDSATEAVNCALTIRLELERLPDVRMRTGIHIGEIIESEGHIYGDGVNVASRLEQLADPDGILISESVFDAIRNKKGLQARALGAHELKNVDHPFQVYELTGQPATLPRLKDLDLPGSRVRWAWASAIVAVGAAAILTVALYTSQQGAQAAPNSIAVLPFKNLSGDPEYEYFGDGLAEELLNTLARIDRLRVAARTSSFYYKDRDTTVRQIGEKLNVSAVLEGSVRRSNGQLRVSVQLVDTEDGFQLWSETYDTGLDNIFQVQTSISSSVAEKLLTTLSPEILNTLEYRPTDNLTAYDLYLRGRAYMQRPKDPEVVQAAISVFSAALQRDSGFAEAYAGLCEAYVSYYEQSRSPEHARSAETHCQDAMRLNRDLPVVRTAIGRLHLIAGRLEEAETELEVAVRESSQPVDAYRTLARVYHAQGRLDEAERTFQLALNLQPTDQRVRTALGNFYYRIDRYQDAAEQYERVVELYPDAASVYTNLGAAHYMLENFEKAASAWRRSSELDPTYHAHYNLGNMYYYLGRFEEAVSSYKQAVEQAPDSFLAWGGVGAALKEIPGRQEDAKEAYATAQSKAEQAIELNPNDYNAHARRALYCDHTGHLECANEAMARARELNVNDPVLDFIEALIVVDSDREDAARLLSRALHRGYPAFLIESEPSFEGLRNEEPLLTALKQSTSEGG